MSESPPDSEEGRAARCAPSPPPAARRRRRDDPDAILRRLEWTVIRRLDGLLQGDYRTLFRAFGLDLADLREYQLHDDVRHIDWNVTARLQTPYVREFHADREVTAWFLLDLSGSVDFGSATCASARCPAELVAVLARLLTRHGNRVGAILYSDKIDGVIPARGGRRHVLHLLDRMLKPAAPAARQGDEPRRAPGKGAAGDQAPLGRLRRLRLHQHAGLGARARAARPAPRDRRRAALRSAGDGAARPGAHRHAGRGDRRAALRRHARRAASAGASRRRPRGARPRCARRSPRPASTAWSSRPTTISSMR